MAQNILTNTIIVGTLLCLYAAVAVAAAEIRPGTTLIRGTIIQPEPGASSIPIVLRGKSVETRLEPSIRSTRQVPAVRAFAGDTLWFVDRKNSSISACWVAGTGRVGVNRVRCTSAAIRN